MMYKEVDRISKRLINELKSKGYELTNENGAINAIIIAIAEAYGEGLERGEQSGKIKTLDLINESINKFSESINKL
jgi:hypothetical protein